MVLVKPATVIQWHRKSFRLYWRWRSRSRSVGRPKVSSETHDLIRQMRLANPLWGAPRIHSERLKLGIESVQFYTVDPHLLAQVSETSRCGRTLTLSSARLGSAI